jgi:hypothetical protein
LAYPQASASKPLVFVHVPKTSGSSVHVGVRQTIPRAEVRLVTGQREAGIEVVKKDKGQFRYVGGHIKYVEAAAIFDSAIYVTAIRNPLHRILSYYFQSLRTRQEKSIEGRLDDLSGKDFFEYYRPVRLNRSNLSCNFICGEADHRKAIQNLKDHFSVVWLADHPETGWPHLFRMLEPDPDAAAPELGSRNAAPIAEGRDSLSSGARPRDYDTFLTEENRQLVTADNLEDLKLFQWLSADGGLYLSPELRDAVESATAMRTSPMKRVAS